MEIKAQVGFYHLFTDVNQILQAAYFLAQKLASSAPARRLEDFENVSTDLDDPIYQEALQGFLLESRRLSRSHAAMEALAASGNGAGEREVSGINDYMARVYRGSYVQIEEYAPGNRKWCVD